MSDNTTVVLLLIVMVLGFGALLAGPEIFRRISDSYGPDGFLRERSRDNRAAKLQKELEEIRVGGSTTAALLAAWQQTQIQTLQGMSNQQIEFFRQQGLITTGQLTFLRDVLGLALTAREKDQLLRHQTSEAGLDRAHELDVIRLQADVAGGKEKTYEELQQELFQTQELLKKATGSPDLDKRTQNQTVTLLLERLRRRK